MIIKLLILSEESEFLLVADSGLTPAPLRLPPPPKNILHTEKQCYNVPALENLRTKGWSCPHYELLLYVSAESGTYKI